jgi:imidazolonepropionase-like amidohydrolase
MVPGWSLHDELQLLVRDVGMTPLDALRAATIGPARALHLESTQGSIAPGKVADLVLVAADPLADIGNLRRIVVVIAAGRPIEPGSDR